jgi:4-aminobutyrate aminotransferase-like enzyme
MASPLLRLRAASSCSPAAAILSSARRHNGDVIANVGRRRFVSALNLGCLDAPDDDDANNTPRTIHDAKSHIARGVGRLTDLVFASGSGSYVKTTCGKSLLDFTSGIGVVNTGHSHPVVIAAAREQLDNIVHSQVNLGYHDKMLELTELLLPRMPRGMDVLYYGTTGAEAVENAVKMARAFTGKHAVVVFRGGYHGRTFGTMAMTVSACRIVLTRVIVSSTARLFKPVCSSVVRSNRRRRREFTGKRASESRRETSLPNPRCPRIRFGVP